MKFLYKIYFALFFVVSLIIFYPFFRVILSKKKWFPLGFKLMKIYGKTWLFFVGVRMNVKGKENIIEKQPFIICANHSSFLDIPCLYALIDQYFVFTGKQEIEKWPLFNIFYTSGMNILVDRHDKARVTKGLKKMIEVINQGLPLMIFPEGTISPTAPQLTEFKTGAVSLAIQKQIPILPITFTTNWKRLQRKGFWTGKASPGISKVIIHPVLSTTGKGKNDMEGLNNELKEIINKPLRELYV